MGIATRVGEVLGLERAASLAEIKSAYRGLALELHPDKNPSAEAAAQFLLVTKAHRVLTDATARDNYEKYGTPDGYQGFTGGVALPLVAENGALLLLGIGLYAAAVGASHLKRRCVARGGGGGSAWENALERGWLSEPMVDAPASSSSTPDSGVSRARPSLN